VTGEPLTIEKIQRLDIQPGDQVVLTVGRDVDQREVAQIKEQWLLKFPDNPCIVLANGLRIDQVIPAGS
jgi:hypothetical protein